MKQTINKEEKELSAKEVMEYIKSVREVNTHKDIDNFLALCLEKAKKYQVTNQKDGLKKVIYLAKTTAMEHKILEAGIDTYIYLEDILEYVNNVKDKQISLIELERYEREIPDEIVETIKMCKDKNLFDEYIIIFTDYKKEMSKKTKKEDVEKDPILLGMLCDKETDIACPRFYYLGDWVDEYCDLTLEKMLSVLGQDKKHDLNSIPKTKEELDNFIASMEKTLPKNNNTTFSINGVNIPVQQQTYKIKENKKKSFFKKVKSIFRRGE